ncbi:hypothetical protein GCM10010123_09140 [Pilimelia anulata]|uniref:STAS domain-containing protein n=1 Tax=Pilimelia anulata TaxID=53371 RepID=A0A8J3B076_9ACTN|nr:STAS domain-containing protein [Pilimelia anulata]GGJ81524.1 hypothetical protein GCM10010123_09140 [Pilimelia anulata]
MDPQQSAHRIPVVEVVLVEAYGGPQADRLRRLLDEALSLRPGRLVVDLARCPSLDAAAIDVLLDAHRRARRMSGALILRGPSERLRRNLALAHAARVLEVWPTRSAAGAPAA